MIRLEFPKVNLDNFPEREKVYALKKQLDFFMDNLQIVLDSIEDDASNGTVVVDKSEDSGGGTVTETDPVFTASPAYGITAGDITFWDGKSNFSGDYNDLTNKPTIPPRSVWYGTSTTSASTAEKTVTCSGFTSANRVAGTIVFVMIGHTNTASVADLKLNINSTGARSIKYMENGAIVNLPSAGFLQTAMVYPFYFDGDYWICMSNGYTETDPSVPTVSSSDNGKVMRVVNGAWDAVLLPSASGVSF